MEILIIIAVVVFVIFIQIAKQRMKSGDVASMHDQELFRYKSQFELRARLCIKAEKYDLYEVYKKRIAEITAEINRRSTGLTREEIKEFGVLIRKRATLVAHLVEKKGFTFEQATTAFLDKIESRQRQYQERGWSEEQALERADQDVCNLIEQSIIDTAPSTAGIAKTPNAIPAVESPSAQPPSPHSATPVSSSWHSPFGQLYIIFFETSPDNFRPEAIEAHFLEALAIHNFSYASSDDPDTVLVGQKEAEILAEAQRKYPHLAALYEERANKWNKEL